VKPLRYAVYGGIPAHDELGAVFSLVNEQIKLAHFSTT
jgi:hypothetical protein